MAILLAILTLVLCQTPPDDQPPPVEELPPASRLGLRVEGVRAGTSTLDVVVVVPDGASYLEAIARWRPQVRYPVLIDDGTPTARDQIARFVRAYSPKRVVLWAHDGGPLPEDESERRSAIEDALVRSWLGDAGDMDDLLSFWRSREALAPGVVVSHPRDPAWTGAIALASFRAQPIVWAGRPSNVNAMMTRAQVDDLAGEIEAKVATLLMDWRDLGDRIDSLTLCLQVPVKYDASTPGAPDREVRATTDRLGRHADDRQGEKRWAWSSQIVGSEASCAYQAMCALFLLPESALLFDASDGRGPYERYALEPPAQVLQQAGLATRLFETPRNTRDVWLSLCDEARREDLVFVNSHGMRDAFHAANNQRLRPGDIPLLSRPAMVYFIHSWSAVQPAARETVGGRWLERGAYAYLGSVNEPYLQGFVPAGQVVRTMRGAFVWGAAVRFPRSPVWKIACFGDPLIVHGAPLRRIEGDPPLDDAEDLAEAMRRSLREQDFVAGVRSLAMLGRDEDAARLVRALLRERNELVTPELAQAALASVMIAGEPAEFFDLYLRLDEERSRDPRNLDMLWNRTRPMRRARDARARALVAYLQTHLRDDQRVEDAADLALTINRLDGPASALSWLNTIAPANNRDERTLSETRARLRRR